MKIARSRHPYLPYLIGIIPIGFTLLGLNNLVNQLTTLSQWVIFITYVVQSAIAIWLAGRSDKGLWTGYVYLAVTASWLTFGPVASIVVSILGAIGAEILHHFTNQIRQNWQQIVREIVIRITVNGLTAIISYTIYHNVFELNVPLTVLTGDVALPLIISITSGYISTQGLAALFTGQISILHMPNWRVIVVLEALLALVAISLPIIIYQAGGIVGVIVQGLIILHAIRFVEIKETRTALQRNTIEMSSLLTLGRAVAISPEPSEVFNIIYTEISKLLTFDLFFVGLYEDIATTIEFPYVIEDGQRVNWATRQVEDDFVQRIIKTQQPYFDQKTTPYTGLDHRLRYATVAGVPLLIGSQVVGLMVCLHRTDSKAFDQHAITLLQTIASQTTLAIRNSTLFENNLDLAQNLSIINRSLQDIMFNLDQSAALSLAAEITMNLVDADGIALYQVGPSSNKMYLSQAMDKTQQNNLSLPEEIPYSVERYRDGSFIVNDIRKTTEKFTLDLAKRVSFQSLIDVPLRSGNTIVGSALIFCHESRFFDRTDIELVELICSQITAAIENAELLQALEVYASEQAQLVHLSRISSSTLDLERVVVDISMILPEMLKNDATLIGLYNAPQNQLEFMVASQNIATFDISIKSVPEIEHLMHEKTPNTYFYHLTTDTISSPLRHFMAMNSAASMAILPMIVNQEFKGVIIMISQNDHQYTDNERRLMEMAAIQISAQVQNARIHKMTEEALVQRLEELSLIEDLVQNITQSLDVKSIINNVIDAVLQATQADFACIALLEEDQPDFDIYSTEIINGIPKKHRGQLAREEGIMGEIIRSGNVILLDDNSKNPNYTNKGLMHEYQSTLAVPLKKYDKVIGVLNVESLKNSFFTPEQATFVKSLAGHAAISIDNANLLIERQYQIHMLTNLRQLTMEATTKTDQKDVNHAIIKTALRIFNTDEGALYQYTPLNQEITATDGLMRNGDIFTQTHPAIPTNLIYQAINQNKLQIVDFDKNQEIRGISTIVVIPIKRRGNIREVLGITFKEKRQFNTRDINTLELLAAQASGHLENVALNAALRTSNDQMRTILDANRDGIILLDRVGRLMDANLAATRLLGIKLNDNLNKPFVKVLLSDQVKMRPSGKNSEDQMTTQSYRIDPQRITEREYIIEHTPMDIIIKELGTPVRDDGGNIIGRLLSLRDVTEEYRVTEYRQKIQSMVIHDLRGPLSSIISSMYLGLSILEEVKEESTRETLLMTLQVSQESANNLLNLVESLRDIPRLEQGKINLRPTEQNLREIVDSAYDTLLASFKEGDQTVEMQIADDLIVYVDPDIIRRVLINLMHNAFKFNPTGEKILIKASPMRDNPNFIQLMVCDNGPGIPAEMRHRIFNEFEQIEGRKPQRGGKGSGLGLTFCKLAVEAHGGTIEALGNGPTQGACFAFTLSTNPSAIPLPKRLQ